MNCLKTALADRYTIERELGSGGMATVYLAEGLKHDRKVADQAIVLADGNVASDERRE
jgi:serine/threonine-protein kinase